MNTQKYAKRKKGGRPKGSPNKPRQERDVLTKNQVIRRSGVGRDAVDEMIREGILRVVFVGKRAYVSKAAYQDWLDNWGAWRRREPAA